MGHKDISNRMVEKMQLVEPAKMHGGMLVTTQASICP